ncbi:hypothetical protein [Citricoccus nitrophenolicus]|uniref:hypothetical protein n=1 Tax=Citricoccus nitrophenolicus TaxID=863575 RepID=UPI0031EF18F5
MTRGSIQAERSARMLGDEPFPPAFWLFLAVCSFLAGGYLALVGHFAPGLHIDETCRSAGQSLDDEYRQHVVHSQVFPISYPCNEQFNLVPWWINPLIALLATVCAVVTVMFVVTFTRRTITWCRNRHKRVRVPWPQRLRRIGPSRWISIAIWALVAIPAFHVGAYLLTRFSVTPWWANALIILAVSVFAVAALFAVVTSLAEWWEIRRETQRSRSDAPARPSEKS